LHLLEREGRLKRSVNDDGVVRYAQA
jgi:hypothetical protein